MRLDKGSLPVLLQLFENNNNNRSTNDDSSNRSHRNDQYVTSMDNVVRHNNNINWLEFQNFLLQRMNPKSAKDRKRYAKQCWYVLDSGDAFPIGGTVVTCSAEDATGNRAEESFTVTVQDTTDPNVEIIQATDRRNRVISESDTTPTPYIRITFEATDAVGVEDIECSLDGQPFTSCTSPVVYDRLSRGTQQVTVRATDELGNTGEDRFLFTIGSPSSAAPPGRQ